MIKKSILILAAILVLAVVGVALVVSRYDFNHLKQPAADAVRRATGRELTVGGDIHVSLGLTPALTVQDIRLANAAWGSRPEMARLGRLEVQVALLPLIRGAVEVERFILIEPDILVETDSRGRSNLDFTTAPAAKTGPADARAENAPGTAALPALALKALEIRDGRFAYRDGASGRTHEVLLSQVQAAMTGIASPLDISVAGSYKNEGFTLDGRLGPLSAALDPAVEWPVALKAEALDITMALDGRIRDLIGQRGIAVDFRLQAPDLNRAAAFSDLSFPGAVALALSGSLKDSGAKAYRVAGLDLKLGDSDLTGVVDLDLAANRPRITADLAAKLIDAAALMPQAQKTPGRQAGAPPASSAPPSPRRLFPDTPLPLDGLNALDAKVKLKIDQLRLPRLALNRLDAALALSNGRLAVAPLSARIQEAVLDGELTLAAGPRSADATLRLAVEQLDLGKALADFKITDAVAGRVDADLNLKTRGASVAALMAAASGHCRLVMEKGRVGKALTDSMGGKIAGGLAALLYPAAGNEAYTDINCCVVRLDLVDGLADTTALVLDTPQITVVGDGRIDLRTERLDIGLTPTAKQGLAAGKFGKLGMSLGELAQPLRLGGTLSQPALAVDPHQTTRILEKALFGKAGIGADEAPNPCEAALQAARTGRKASPTPARSDTGTAPAPRLSPEQVGETLIKGLFGN